MSLISFRNILCPQQMFPSLRSPRNIMGNNGPLLPVRTAHSREFVYDFCFVSCKTSQNVAFRIYLHEGNSNFYVNRHFQREALCFILPDISLDENLHGCKNH